MFTRLGSRPATRAYAERRTQEGKSKAEIIRCLKRYVAREVYPTSARLRADAHSPGTAWPNIRLPHPLALRTIRRPSPAVA